ncbi:MAG TPA: PIN domain-containing protein [Thermoanaerobaculia bacterium]|nr:PIN domain-containing protein [Thermoanaerobaculia bacterium]
MILLDAGPMVALLHADDGHHQQCKETLRTLAEPLISVWPVVTEAMYLLGFSWRAQDALWEFLERRGVTVVPLELRDFARMRELMKKYQDLPMDLADAALVRVAERERIHRIFTLDRRDFLLYRPEGLEPFQIVPEDTRPG